MIERFTSSPQGIPLYRPTNGQHSRAVEAALEEGESGQVPMMLFIQPDQVRRAKRRADMVSCVVNVACVVMGILIGWLLRGGR